MHARHSLAGPHAGGIAHECMHHRQFDSPCCICIGTLLAMCAYAPSVAATVVLATAHVCCFGSAAPHAIPIPPHVHVQVPSVSMNSYSPGTNSVGTGQLPSPRAIVPSRIVGFAQDAVSAFAPASVPSAANSLTGGWCGCAMGI